MQGVLAYRAEIREEVEAPGDTTASTPVPPTPPPGEQPTGPDGPEVSMEEPTGLLYARTSKTVKLTLAPHRRRAYRYQLLVFTAAVEGNGRGAVVPDGGRPTAVLPITADASFPLLQVGRSYPPTSMKLGSGTMRHSPPTANMFPA